MLAYTTASRQDVPTTRAGWRVCQCFYDLIRKNDAQRQRQARKCVMSGCNSRDKLRELGEASLFVPEPLRPRSMPRRQCVSPGSRRLALEVALKQIVVCLC